MLISCIECGSQISDRAAACPQCGMPLSVSNEKPVDAKKNLGGITEPATDIQLGKHSASRPNGLGKSAIALAACLILAAFGIHFASTTGGGVQDLLSKAQGLLSDTPDPALIAAAVVKESIRSPSTFQYVSGSVLWTGLDESKNPAYIARVIYDAQNDFGAIIRSCAMVAYAQRTDGTTVWNKNFGVNGGCDDSASMVQVGGEKKYIEFVASMNNFREH